MFLLAILNCLCFILLFEESIEESAVIIGNMIKDMVKRLDEIVPAMENTHAKEVLNLITIKKSYDRKVAQLGKGPVDRRIRISKANHKKKINGKPTTTDC